MSPIPYIFFDGRCAEAMAFYADLIGEAAPELLRVADSQMAGDVAPDRQDWILHGSLKTKGGMLMGSDDVFGTAAPMAGASLMLSYPSASQARAVFDRLAAGGEVEMAFEPTFWSTGFGTCRDRYGISWMVGSEEMPPST